MNFVWGKKGDKCVEDAFSVRLQVFVEEQGFSADIEIDDVDNTANHITGYNEQDEAVCAARLFNEHNTVWHVGRVAVKKSLRGTGAGKILMGELAKKAKQLGATEIVLGAQYDKAGFYEKCGYLKTGKEFLDEGYPHVEMKLVLI